MPQPVSQQYARRPSSLHGCTNTLEIRLSAWTLSFSAPCTSLGRVMSVNKGRLPNSSLCSLESLYNGPLWSGIRAVRTLHPLIISWRCLSVHLTMLLKTKIGIVNQYLTRETMSSQVCPKCSYLCSGEGLNLNQPLKRNSWQGLNQEILTGLACWHDEKSLDKPINMTTVAMMSHSAVFSSTSHEDMNFCHQSRCNWEYWSDNTERGGNFAIIAVVTKTSSPTVT